MKKRIELHCGDVSSYHNAALEKYHAFRTPKATIVENFASTTKVDKVQYMSRLTYSLKCLKFLLRQGLACRGHDESEDSLNKGNFLELLNWLAENFEEVGKVVLNNAPKNCKLTAPKIQRDIINCCAKETTNLIMEDLGGECFAILADESSDVYQKEQLALCLRYVDKRGKVVERFLGVVHVENTTSSTLKAAIQSLLMDHSLSLSMVRGQGYDGASNMKGL
ncbi:zinc finger MYM-type protein 1-like [Panicum virgatum]|uniref:zinc finger MYM-type protein 1-like n=1 Tax=Panicum virgatum TaxID=38727 RepID=UPI0019D6645A|nr:zinc finger MYM-type protein 1-like [Panicum virgatum]